LWLGCEERNEEVLLLNLRNAASIVFHFKPSFADSNRHPVARRACVEGIAYQVPDDLFDSNRVHENCRLVGWQFKVQNDSGRFEFGPAKVGDPGDNFAKARLSSVQIKRPRELQEFAAEAIELVGFLTDHGSKLFGLTPEFTNHLRRPPNPGQGVADFVGDRSRHLANLRQASGFGEFVLDALGERDVLNGQCRSSFRHRRGDHVPGARSIVRLRPSFRALAIESSVEQALEFGREPGRSQANVFGPGLEGTRTSSEESDRFLVDFAGPALSIDNQDSHSKAVDDRFELEVKRPRFGDGIHGLSIEAGVRYGKRDLTGNRASYGKVLVRKRILGRPPGKTQYAERPEVPSPQWDDQRRSDFRPAQFDLAGKLRMLVGVGKEHRLARFDRRAGNAVSMANLGAKRRRGIDPGPRRQRIVFAFVIAEKQGSARSMKPLGAKDERSLEKGIQTAKRRIIGKFEQRKDVRPRRGIKRHPDNYRFLNSSAIAESGSLPYTSCALKSQDRFPIWLFRAACLCIGAIGVAAAITIQPGRSRQAHSPEIPAKIDFNRDVRPILSKHCWPCHGTDKAALQATGGQSLDSFAGATKDRGGYQAIAPGNLAKSMLWQRIHAPEDSRMPPKTAPVDPLNEHQKAILKRWIEQGAEYRGHWAFERPTMPVLPTVRNSAWVRNPIDRFVLARLEEANLKPAAEASKEHLIRRLSLTLTGLPPTPGEVKAFLADRKPGAYERVVDRLLASPRYGEHQARYWLDAVRYADTHGLHIDNERAVYPYRDWVVRAYNQDLTFDKFTQYQLGGDLFREPTTEQMIATGYVRMNPTTAEGGVIEAEFLAKNTFDRLDTTATIFMGLTVGCAKCHDHKYDPISIKDYYRMYAFFNSTTDPVLDGNLKLHQPVMKAPDPDQDRELRRMKEGLDKIIARANRSEALTWLQANAHEPPAIGKWEISAGHGAADFDKAYDTDFGPEPGGATDSVAWKPIDLKDGVVRAQIVGKENAAAYLRATITTKSAAEYTLRLGSDDAIKVWLNGQLVHENKALRPVEANQDSAKVQTKAGSNEILIKVVNAGGNDGVFFGLNDDRSYRLSKAKETLANANAPSTGLSESLGAFLELGPESELAKVYRKQLSEYRKLEESVPFSYIVREMPKPRPTFVLKRGNYEMIGEPVDRNIPEIFGKWKEGRPRNRLGLAQWFLDPANPLTSRVTVNRVWQQHFGTGIVASPEDFGSRGEWPSHPELLDYLAVKFVKDGWSLKKLHKLIVTSAAFRQSSAVSAEKAQKDPGNRLISRGPRFRLDAEVVRDQALFLSGLLVEKPGGRGDKPYQPPGLWEAIAYPISDTARYTQDKGDALYRRSLYLFWKRTSPPPAMMIFDAPMRESCVVQRSRTNTPTQALVTLNETGFFESARTLAQRVLKAKADDAARLNYVFRAATGRAPDAKEVRVLRQLLSDRLAGYQKRPEDAKNLLSIGDAARDESLDPAIHAAWTLVCNAILNLDEVLTQH